MNLPSHLKKSKSRKQKRRKRNAKSQIVVETKLRTVQDPRSIHKSAPVENRQNLLHTRIESAEDRLAALKAELLQAKVHVSPNCKLDNISPDPAIVPHEACYARLKADVVEDIAQKRIASPELVVPADDDYWGMLNYEKRSEKINMELIDLFLGDSRR